MELLVWQAALRGVLVLRQGRARARGQSMGRVRAKYLRTMVLSSLLCCGRGRVIVGSW